MLCKITFSCSVYATEINSALWFAAYSQDTYLYANIAKSGKDSKIQIEAFLDKGYSTCIGFYYLISETVNFFRCNCCNREARNIPQCRTLTLLFDLTLPGSVSGYWEWLYPTAVIWCSIPVRVLGSNLTVQVSQRENGSCRRGGGAMALTTIPYHFLVLLLSHSPAKD